LAVKYGLDGNVWDNNVEKMILNLSKQEYYRDEVVKNGYMKGNITYNYVKTVFDRYEEWKRVFK
jgi:membrane-bound lytic murein transglycosylase F